MHLFSHRVMASMDHRRLKKLLLIMKLTAMMVLVATLHVSAKGFTQQVTLSEKKCQVGEGF